MSQPHATLLQRCVSTPTSASARSVGDRAELHQPDPAARAHRGVDRRLWLRASARSSRSSTRRGARADRPKLQAAIERIERGESDGIVVAKLDRFGRSLMDGLQLIDRIRDAGGTFASVQDGFDLGTDTGRLVLRIMFSMAEYELDRVRGSWYDARARAVMRGIHPSARTPFGYARERQGTTPGGAPKYVGPLLRDPRTGPLVTELYRRRVEQRASHSELARWLTSLGVPTAAGRTSWSQRGVRDIIANRVYMGIAYASDVENPMPTWRSSIAKRGAWRSAQVSAPIRARPIPRR